MAELQIASRNPDGTTYFAPDSMGSWLYGNIVEVVEGGFNGSFVEPDYITVQMSAVPGFPQLFFRLYGNFSLFIGDTSIGTGTYVAAGSIINTIEVIDASGFVYNRLSGISFAVNSDKTTFAAEPINAFAYSFQAGETPDMAGLMAGHDNITGTSGTEILSGYDGHDAIFGYGGSDGLYGGAGNDSLNGGAAADNLYGGFGNDLIIGYTAGDFIDGGGDFDTWSLTGTYSSGLSLPTPYDYTSVNLTSIEAIQIIWGEIGLNSNQVGGFSTVQTITGGSSDRDALRVTMTPGFLVMNLSTVNFVNWNNYSGNVDLITLIGSSGNDTIDGSAMSDVIYANAGANVVRGWQGADKINGADNADILRGGDGDDTLVGWGGNDTLIGDDNTAPYPNSQIGWDNIYGGDGNDVMSGVVGHNIIDGGAGIDTVDYGFIIQNPAENPQYPVIAVIDLSVVVNPNDPNSAASAYYNLDLTEVFITYVRDILVGIENVDGSDYGETIIGNAVANRLFGWGGNDVISGRAGADNINGGFGNDRLYGESENDLLLGGKGKDTLFGGAEADRLNGGIGNDIMNGGLGADRFIFDAALVSNVDRIVDYSVSADTIALENAVFTGLAAGALVNARFKNLSLAAADADDRILWNATTGDLFFDIDGAGGVAAIRFAIVASATALTAADVLIL